MYSVRVLRPVIKDIADLPKVYVRLISQHIDGLAHDPRPAGALKLQGETGYRLRVGVYRVLYDIDDQAHEVIVYRIKHRRDVYR